MATPDIAFALADFTVEVSGAGYPVQLSPDPTLFSTTDSSGEVTFANVTPGIYVLNAPGTGIPSLRITVPDEAGPLDAIDLVNTGQGWVAPGGTPEGRIAAPPQSRYYDPVNDVDYVKASGTGTTGWQELVATLLLMLWTVGAQAADPRVRGTAVVPRSAVESTAYDATSWNGNTNAATKDAIRDKVETLAVGASVWTNSAGIVKPAGGQTATNRLQFVSGAADNATNAAVVVDTSASWADTDARLLSLRHIGTNVAGFGTKGGLVLGGPNSETVVSSLLPDTTMFSAHVVSLGDDNENKIYLQTLEDLVNTSGASIALGTSLAEGETNAYSRVYLESFSGDGSSSWEILTHSEDDDSALIYTQRGGGTGLAFRPELPDSANATAYYFATGQTLSTTGSKIADFVNNGVKLSVMHDGRIITQGGAAITPASAGAAGTAGTILWDSGFIYVCVSANTWKRVAIATW
jgi:hypothetical protein